MDFIVRNSRSLRVSVILLGLLSIFSVLAYVYEAERRFETISDVLSSRLLSTTETTNLLSELFAEIGYGGFIHNFKNYVLRRDPLYKQQAQENYQHVLTILNKLESHVVNSDDAVILNEIQGTLDEYISHLDDLSEERRIENLIKEDARVKVDDTKAINAIRQLYQMVERLSDQTLTDAFLKRDSAHQFINYGYLLALFISIVAMFLLLLINRLEAKTLQANVANRAKGRFLSTMSHEIRTPLNGMLGLVQLLDTKNLTKEEKHHLSLIQSSGEMLLDILNDVLDMSKIEAHELKLETVPFDVEHVLTTTVDFYKNVASEKGLLVKNRCTLPDGLYLNGDPTKLRQILSNILANSVKFTEVGSISVSSECEIVNLGKEKEICNLHIRLVDTGIGMDEDGVANLFEKFSQADDSIRRKYGGTGLGMAIVKDLCELMGGTIEVHSIYGEGTSFQLTIPMVVSSLEERQFKEPSEQAFQDAFKDLDVLVAEDNMVNAVVARGFLENLGVSVRVAHDGAEVVKMFDRKQPDIILMDVNMPIKDGIQATREIRTRETDKHIPILALTADAFAETQEKCIQAGMNGTVPKPFSFDLLRHTIYEAVKDREIDVKTD